MEGIFNQLSLLPPLPGHHQWMDLCYPGVLSRKMAPGVSYSLVHPLVSMDVLAPGKERKHGQPGFHTSSI